MSNDENDNKNSNNDVGCDDKYVVYSSRSK